MKKSVPDQNLIVLNYLVLAHGDYVASRHLLRNGFLEHGAMLAATAAEKYLKAVIGIHGVSNKDHLGGNLYKLVGRCQPALYESLDKEFLKFLEKAYKLRYASASSPGLAIVINQYRTLIAFDYFIKGIDHGFEFKSGGAALQTPYCAGVESADPNLIEDNAAVNESCLSTLVQRNNKVLEIKIEKNYSTLRIEYETEGVNINGIFTKIPELSLMSKSFFLSRG